MEIPPESPAIRSQGRQTLGDEGETRLGEDYSEVSTHAQGWRSMRLEYYQLERLHLSAHRWEHLSVLLYLEPVDSLLFQIRDRWEACEVRPGHFSIHPQGSTTTIHAPSRAAFLLIRFLPTFIAQAIHNHSAIAHLRLPTRSPKVDPYVEGVGRQLLGTLLDESKRVTSAKYAESIASSLIVHLMTQYGVAGTAELDTKPGLSPSQLKKALQSAQFGLQEKVTVETMARSAGLTKFHFSRQFKQSMGMSPSRYLMKQRAELAKNLLLEPSLSIADVARKAGFSDQSHLTLNFRMHFGITPKKFRSSLHRH